MIIWFNGPSQRSLAETLPRQDAEIGCNYIEKIRPVDAVCAFDIDVVLKLRTLSPTLYYTRADARVDGWRLVNNDIVSGANSGILACWVAVNEFNYDGDIYIIGCDWGLTDHSRFDGIYGKGATRKYTNHGKKKMQRLFERHSVFVVNDEMPDVPVPVISEKQFLRKIQ